MNGQVDVKLVLWIQEEQFKFGKGKQTKITILKPEIRITDNQVPRSQSYKAKFGVIFFAPSLSYIRAPSELRDVGLPPGIRDSGNNFGRFSDIQKEMTSFLVVPQKNDQE